MSDASVVDGRVAVVTGAVRGIGLETVRLLVARGYAIVAVDLDGSTPMTGIDEAGASRIVRVEADVSAEDGWIEIIDTCRSDFGRLDVVVNNAAWEGPICSLLDYPIDDFDRVMSVNVRSVFLGIKMSAPLIRVNEGGSIINLSSIVGTRAGAGVGGYAASKHAVIGLTRTAAVELAPDVRVNAVCPSPTDTRMMDVVRHRVGHDASPQDFERDFSASNPSKRFARPEEIAETIAFLAGPASSYITGAVIPVDGGASAK